MTPPNRSIAFLAGPLWPGVAAKYEPPIEVQLHIGLDRLERRTMVRPGTDQCRRICAECYSHSMMTVGLVMPGPPNRDSCWNVQRRNGPGNPGKKDPRRRTGQGGSVRWRWSSENR